MSIDSSFSQGTSPESTSREGSQGSSSKWFARAKAFDVFPRPDPNPKPSTWWLIIFAVRLFFLPTYTWMRTLWVKFSSTFPKKSPKSGERGKEKSPQDIELGVVNSENLPSRPQNPSSQPVETAELPKTPQNTMGDEVKQERRSDETTVPKLGC
ncbi:hypothetical protein HYFRA_00006900 [Hymenoscyphus fraxineus]|uniref:Uncharacterized protein n=1 Tax=Hymenoscyphus fraxineus TaxID=746836 RepID=A0A9N9PQF6_9HELO|nr:hypothetical protein HYFRA_00006900 [Hymenoscyphus fraxineus]